MAMARGRNLSHDKRVQCVALRDAGFSQRRIAAQVRCSRQAVRKAVRRHDVTDAHNDLPRVPRVRVSTRRQENQLVQLANENPWSTSTELTTTWRENCGVLAHPQTVRNR